MTNNITPQQMRELANEWQQQLHDAAMTQSEKDKRERTVAALRAAADQLDAVRDRDRISSAIGEVLSNVSNYPPEVSFRLLGLDIGPLRRKVTDAVLVVLAADPAPQEDRDE